VTDSDDWKSELSPRIADEVSYIRDRFHEKNVDIGFVREGAGVGYMYAAGELLVLERNLPQVTDFLGQTPGIQLSGDPRYVLGGLAVVSFTGGPAVPDVLEEMDQVLGPGRATPNHLLTVSQIQSTGEVSPCEPVEPGEVLDGIEPYPSVCVSNSGAGVRVYISDTGLLPDADQHPWLVGVTGEPDPLSPVLTGGDLVPYCGHGTFSAGVVRCMAPAADVYVSNAFATAGSGFETDLLADLQAALRWGSDILHLPGTGPTRNNLPLLSFSQWLRQLRDYKGICLRRRRRQQRMQPGLLACSLAARHCRRRARHGLAQPGQLQQLRRLGRRLRTGQEPHQRLHHRPVRPSDDSLRRPGSAQFLRDGAQERHLLLRCHRCRDHRRPDVAQRRERGRGLGRPASRGTVCGDTRSRRDHPAVLRRSRLPVRRRSAPVASPTTTTPAGGSGHWLRAWGGSSDPSVGQQRSRVGTGPAGPDRDAVAVGPPRSGRVAAGEEFAEGVHARLQPGAGEAGAGQRRRQGLYT
jgi:hypothetical protein